MKIISPNGHPHYGILDTPASEINVHDFLYLNCMGKKRTFLSKKLNFKTFQYMGILTDDFIIGVALIDIQYIGKAFIYFYDKKSKELKEYSYTSPFGLSTNISLYPNSGTSKFSFLGNKFEMIGHGDESLNRSLKVTLRSGDSIDVTFNRNQMMNPLCVSTKAGYTGWAYTQKLGGYSVKGNFKLNNKIFNLNSNHSFGITDLSYGHMRRETSWSWANSSGKIGNDFFSFNFSCGVNETSFTENGFWVNENFYKVNSVNFSYNKQNLYEPWTIKSFDGKVNLKFFPEGEKKEKQNFYVLASNFTQMLGQFHGELHLDDRILQIKDIYGWGEDHYSKW